MVRMTSSQGEKSNGLILLNVLCELFFFCCGLDLLSTRICTVGKGFKALGPGDVCIFPSSLEHHGFIASVVQAWTESPGTGLWFVQQIFMGNVLTVCQGTILDTGDTEWGKPGKIPTSSILGSLVTVNKYTNKSTRQFWTVITSTKEVKRG